jgi:hypothetical protein
MEMNVEAIVSDVRTGFLWAFRRMYLRYFMMERSVLEPGR